MSAKRTDSILIFVSGGFSRGKAIQFHGLKIRGPMIYVHTLRREWFHVSCCRRHFWVDGFSGFLRICCFPLRVSLTRLHGNYVFLPCGNPLAQRFWKKNISLVEETGTASKNIPQGGEGIQKWKVVIPPKWSYKQKEHVIHCDTVDGWNLAPPGMYETLKTMG